MSASIERDSGAVLVVRSYYAAHAREFLLESDSSILGKLTQGHQFSLDELQRNAWLEEVQILKDCLSGFPSAYVLLEYAIPRVGKRIDAVVLTGGTVFALEFKVGASQYSSADIDQVYDYALDLKNFHEQSHDKRIVPVLVATEAPPSELQLVSAVDGVFAPVFANRRNLAELLTKMAGRLPASDLDPTSWRDSRYRPTPTIIEAAQALYLGHGVAEISRSDAGATNLTVTTQAIVRVIEDTKARREKAICFVTGVPGAGKTLAGLNIANARLQAAEEEHTVFLSGNGPLVKVLREALARNDAAKIHQGNGRTLKLARSKTAAFIQNIHHFRDAALDDTRPPLEKVVIFDEAQRAWTLEQTATFMRRKRGIGTFTHSEPEFLISVMDRHSDWAVIVCLVGGGQEINTGEAGLGAWFAALEERFPNWRVHVSDQLLGREYLGNKNLPELITMSRVTPEPHLHLGVSIRSFRSERVSEFVRLLLEDESGPCRELLTGIQETYPVMLTRDIDQARQWLRGQARGSERFGLVASSGASRLRPLGIDVKAGIDVIHWFLGPKEDVRSSYFGEVVASEFDVQGLELDWTAVVWDANLRHSKLGWEYFDFRGTRWDRVNDTSRRQYLTNAYRVLLTRARQGMVVVVPEGNSADWTRPPELYDAIYDHMRSLGLRLL